MNNGFATPLFKLARGVRQGDLLFPYVFILVLEVLAINVRSDTTIKRIKINEQELKLVISADDLFNNCLCNRYGTFSSTLG